MQPREGIVFNIQGYSIHDGPGVRTTVFLSGCPLRCRWCQNPESNTVAPKLFFIAEKCTGCGRCVPHCPSGAISVAGGHAHTDRTRCTACGACIKACVTDAREISGERMNADAVLARVMKDKIFYDASGGGVTLSGGEVLAQPEFAAELLRRCGEEGLHTAVETCGFAPWERARAVLERADLVLYDLKHMDPDRHRWGTGVDNELILENARRIYHELKKPMAARVPTIPGYNDSEENIAATARFVARELGTDVKFHLLPYHRLGGSKHERMEDDADWFDTEPPSKEHMEDLRRLAAGFGLDAVVGG